MIDRTYIHVAGPPKVGKTTLIEHLLRTFDGFVLVARCQQVESRGESRETRPAGNRELRRYLEAGATDAARYRFSARHAVDGSFFETGLMEDYSDSVILEGDRALSYVDLSVYVAEPCQEDAGLLVRAVRDRAREEEERMDALERLLDEPGGMARIIQEMVGRERGE